MKPRARFVLLAAIAALAISQLGGCADTPSTFYSVILSPKGPMYVAQGSTNTISASVLNDTANGGVTYTISPTGIGTLTQTSSSTATYTAPANVAASTTVVITATAVDYPKSSSTLTINIEPPPVITTTTLASGSVGAAYSAQIVATGGVPPLSWALASGSLPAGLALGTSKNDTVTISGKPTANGPSTFTVSVTDAAGEVATSQQLSIVISTLAITTTSPLPSATFTTPPTPYSEQFAASGGLAPYTWSVATGSTLPAGLSLSSSGLLSGSPTVQGNFTFGITVVDSEATPANVTQTFALSIAGPQNLALLTGNYAFTFSGNNSTGGAVTTAGSFVADGNGNITSGEQDTNSVSATAPTNTPNLTGTYTLGTDGRGTITLSNAPGAPTYAFSIDLAGLHGRLIELDTTGTRGSGRIEKQSVTTCAVTGDPSNTYGGTFVFAGAGYAIANSTTNAGPTSFVGTFAAEPPISPSTQGSLDNGEADGNIAGYVSPTPGPTGLGLYQSGADNTHCSFTLQPLFGQLDYNAYPVSSSEAFLVQVDPVSSTSPFVSTVDLRQQFGYPFVTQGTITSNLAGGLVGQLVSGTASYSPEVEIMQVSPQSSGAFNLLLTDNTAGSVLTNMATSSTSAQPLAVNYSSDQYGRITTNLTSPYSLLMYLISSQEAFVMSDTNGTGYPVLLGHLDSQSAPETSFTLAYLDGTFVEGSAGPPPSTAARNVSGFFALDGEGNITGTQDESTTSGKTQAENVAGTYSVLDATNGTGAVALTQPAIFAGQYVIVSPTKFVMITSTSGDANPILIIEGH